ncbi:MAG: extracellular solute-binding protein [Eubacteriales bacterium]|nr:extracellular solute-binding protein [Eubacteriales bacterium]
MRRKGLLKKTAALCLTAAMAFAAGCGNSGSATASQAPAESAGTSGTAAAGAESDGASAATKFEDEVTIRVMLWDRGDAAPGTTTENNTLTQWLKEQIKETYNINVEYVAVPRSSSDDSLNIMMSGGTAPDIVFTYDQAMFYNFASNGALADLTEVYSKYGSNIEEYCQEAQGIGTLGDVRYAVMKQRGTEQPRHMAYIRQDWLDELNMEMPTTKAELGEYLKAVKENKLGGDNTVPWAMGGRGDTEKNYLNFVGSYVTLADDREAYIYNEAYMAVAPGSKDGLKQLNEWYNEGLITRDFPTDTSEDVMKADIANGNAGFILTDLTEPWDSFKVLNSETGGETFVPLYCFDLPDGSYRNPFEYRYAMFVMVPSTTSGEKLDACMMYLNWLADPENAKMVRYTPDLTENEEGVAVEPNKTQKDELGYPGTPDDLCIMNLNFDWVNDPEVLAQTDFDNQETQWASLEWFQNFYTMRTEHKFRFPTFGYISQDEQTFGADIKARMIEFVYTVVCAPSDQFESVYESGYAELVNAGLQKILDGRAAYYDSLGN